MLATLLLIALQSAPVTDAPSKATEKLIELRALLDDNQCEKVVALSPYVEDHRLATPAERHEAMFARAYCLINSLGNIAEAGTVFQEILEEDIKANPPFDVEPKFQVLVDGARATLIEARRAKAEAEHAKKIARIDFDVSGSRQVKGGSRVIFDVKLTDPDDVVRSMRVDFRKKGDREYYALPVSKRADGSWHGEVPGTYTRSSTGTTLEWYLTLSDDDGTPLKASGTREAPHALEILPGSAIAEDLKANERLPQYGRVLFAVGAPFALTAGSFAISYATGQILLPEELAQIAPLLFAAGSATLPFFANYFISALLLDGTTALIPPIVCFVFGSIVALTVVFDYPSYVALAQLGNPPGPQNFTVGTLVGLGASVSGVVFTTAVTTTLVILDPPADE
jgi:hypothetical protein